jgi:RimJ/RimL family protein N-acetyltransferase
MTEPMSDQSSTQRSWEERSLVTSGGRLLLEPLTREHANEMAVVLEDPSLNEHIGGRPPSVEQLSTRYEALSTRRSPGGDELWFNWIIRLGHEGPAVGYIQATVSEEAAALAWVIGVPWQKAGIATEAAAAMVGVLHTELAVTRFSASIAPNHLPSQRVASKLGMRRSGRIVDGEEIWVINLS